MRLSLTRPGRPPSACFHECSLHCMTAKRVLIPVGLDSWPLRYAFSDSGLAQMSRTSPGPEGGNSVRRPQPGSCPVPVFSTTIVQYLLSRRGSSDAAGVASSDLDRYSLAGAGSAFPLSCRRAADQPAPSRPLTTDTGSVVCRQRCRPGACFARAKPAILSGGQRILRSCLLERVTNRLATEA